MHLKITKYKCHTMGFATTTLPESPASQRCFHVLVPI